MSRYLNYFKITGLVFFVIIFIFFSTLKAKNFDKFNKANNISDYMSGVLLLNQNKYADSNDYLKKLNGLEEIHSNYSSKYLYTLVNSGNFNQAFNFSKKLEKTNKDSFESNLIIGIYNLKNSNYDLAEKYFLKATKKNTISLLNNYILGSLIVWSNLKDSDLEKAIFNLNQLDDRLINLRKIQNVFLYCYFKNNNTSLQFQKLTSDPETDFSRYNFFYAKYLDSLGQSDQAKKIITLSLEKYPRNLLLNQYKIDLENFQNNLEFDCKDEKDISAELLYIAANALSSQSIFPLSNFYLNLSKYLNQNFHAYDTLLAENFYKIQDYSNAKKIYTKLFNFGSAFKWYSNKQLSNILIQEDKKKDAIKLLRKSYNELPIKGIYETFDYAEFLKNNEEFERSIKIYSEIIDSINTQHPLYPEATDGRGVAYERIGEWDKAEKDLLMSLKINPDQAYVINYLAYSWIEKGIKTEESLSMLEKANKLKSNDPYIIDSLGWALFKLERYKESKDYLQLAVRLMPADPIVNDHYGDALWKNGKKIQARYYWKYVLSLEKAEKDLKEKIKKKITKGL